jgi:hypothetical protein
MRVDHLEVRAAVQQVDWRASGPQPKRKGTRLAASRQIRDMRSRVSPCEVVARPASEML